MMITISRSLIFAVDIVPLYTYLSRHTGCYMIIVLLSALRSLSGGGRTLNSEARRRDNNGKIISNQIWPGISHGLLHL